ncbi:hypothetical protein ABZ508_35320 [Streptomyces lavendulocolor]|uniref:Uncharacterized protein n=1 Tax=Streptomyces lavendulocolor TaxID=67316 RepID=A0ABV2WH11_9ACTN
MRTTRVTPSHRTYVEVSYVNGYGRFEAELSFGASDKRRALEHRNTAVALTGLYGVEWRTPWSLTPGWTVYRELSDGTRFGRLDERRMIVSGPARNVARYLAALPRVLAGLEAAATRAARVFGRWRRSLMAVLSGHLDYEDPSTLRVRAREFRTDVLRHLVDYLRTPPAPAANTPARPMWEQAAAVAAEVWADRPVDPWDVPEDDVSAILTAAGRYAEPSVIELAPAAEDSQEGQAAEGEALAVEDDAHQEHGHPVAEARAEITGDVRTRQVTGTPRSRRLLYRAGDGSRFAAAPARVEVTGRGRPSPTRRRPHNGGPVRTRTRPRIVPARCPYGSINIRTSPGRSLRRPEEGHPVIPARFALLEGPRP